MRSLKQIIAAFLLAVLLVGLTPAAAFGAEDSITLTAGSTIFVMRGNASHIDVEVDAPEETSYKLLLSCDDRTVSLGSAASGVLTGNAQQSFAFTPGRSTETGYKTFTVRAVDASDASILLAERHVYVDVVDNIDSYSSLGHASINVSYAITGSDSLKAGETNFVKLTLFNRSRTGVDNAKVTLTMPQGITIQSGPASRNIGAFAVGETRTVDYPILVDKDMVSGSYPITVTVEGVSGGADKSAAEVVYFPLIGKEMESEDTSIPVIALVGNKVGNDGGAIKKGSNFNLELTLKNTGKTKSAKDITITVNDASGAVAPASSELIYLEELKAGGTTVQTIPMRAVEDTDDSTANVNVAMNYYDEDGKQYSNTAQFSVNLEDSSTTNGKGVSNPILMVTNASFGGTSVQAGSEFPLSLTVTNTSGKSLRNIKVTVDESKGMILPSQGSNSFFISSIGAGASYGKLLPMLVTNDAVAGNGVLMVKMSYEDMDGKALSSEDTITVPIIQQDRLVIDEVLDPGYLVAGEMGYAQIKYYNMGKTTLNNLRIAVSGDFTIDGDSSLYVGNMANGRSDYFSFNFIPNGEGEMNGKAVFTYENSQGEEQVIEKEFTFNIQPAPEFNPEDMDFPVEEEKHGFAALPIWGKGLVALGALLAVILVIKGIKKHKKAKAEALTLDE